MSSYKIKTVVDMGFGLCIRMELLVDKVMTEGKTTSIGSIMYPYFQFLILNVSL